MNTSKNKNTPNPSTNNNSGTTNNQSKNRDNAIENIKTSHPTKK